MRLKLVSIIALVLICVGASGVLALGGNIERVSVDSVGNQGNKHSFSPSISSDGHYVAFSSWANNLVPTDTNGCGDIFVRDWQANTTTRVSISDNGIQANNESGYSSISSDGRYVAFISSASNLIINDTNGYIDIFVRDRQLNTTTRVSVSDNNTQANDESLSPSVNYDGHFVAFQSAATNLVPSDNNNSFDIFIHDLQINMTTRVSVSDNGTEGNGYSYHPSISSDGRYVAFSSFASNLVLNDYSTEDVFVRDLQLNTTILISISNNGTQGNDDSYLPSISSDGRYVAFFSYASNLVTNDTNNTGDIFIRDRQMNTTTRVNISDNGTEGNGISEYPSISSDGRYIAFESVADNLVDGDTNGVRDIFIHDRTAGATVRVSVSDNGTQSNGVSLDARISGDGSHIAFYSHASNLVANDTNSVSDVFVCDNPLYEGLPPSAPTPPSAPPPSPRASPSLPRQLNTAQMSLQYLSVNPQQARANQPLTITGNVVNTGDQAGNYNLALKINGKVEQTRMVSVGPQATQPVKFTVAKSQPGTYIINIGGQRSSFTVIGENHSSDSASRGSLITILAISILILITIVILLINRRTA